MGTSVKQVQVRTFGPAPATPSRAPTGDHAGFAPTSQVMTEQERMREVIREILSIIRDVQTYDDLTPGEFYDIMLDVLINGVPDPDQRAVLSVVKDDGTVLRVSS